MLSLASSSGDNAFQAVAILDILLIVTMSVTTDRLSLLLDKPLQFMVLRDQEIELCHLGMDTMLVFMLVLMLWFIDLSIDRK